MIRSPSEKLWKAQKKQLEAASLFTAEDKKEALNVEKKIAPPRSRSKAVKDHLKSLRREASSGLQKRANCADHNCVSAGHRRKRLALVPQLGSCNDRESV
jgi:hypothetical protein